MRKNANIFYFGTYGFPIGYAQIERQKLISKGLIAQGCNMTIISRYGIHTDKSNAAELEKGEYEGIHFRYASGSPYRPASFLKRTWMKFKGAWNELQMIRKQKKNGGLDYMIISTNTFYNILVYRFYSLLTGVPTLLDTVEHWSSFGNFKNEKWFIRNDNYLYDYQSAKYVNKVLCISDFLMDFTRKVAPGKPTLKIPAIVDYSKFKTDKKIEGKYLLYCGAAAYYEVLFFILESFEKINNRDYHLYIVSHGSPPDMARVMDRINSSPKKACISVFSKLPYSELVALYLNSKALLIPLRNNPQDIARFPHKTGEYCASAKPIVATNIGEFKNYFTDEVNALLAADYDVDMYAEKLRFVIENPEKAEEIGRKAYETGKREFDNLALGKKIYDFLSE